jgi:hypothetical protein
MFGVCPVAFAVSSTIESFLQQDHRDMLAVHLLDYCRPAGTILQR